MPKKHYAEYFPGKENVSNKKHITCLGTSKSGRFIGLFKTTDKLLLGLKQPESMQTGCVL